MIWCKNNENAIEDLQEILEGHLLAIKKQVTGLSFWSYNVHTGYFKKWFRLRDMSSLKVKESSSSLLKYLKFSHLLPLPLLGA